MAHYILPEEAAIIHKAAVALRTIKDRARSVSFDTIAPWDIEGMNSSEQAKELRRRSMEIRKNASLDEAAQMAESSLLNMIVSAHSGSCEVATYALGHWHDKEWEGPEFGVKR